MKLIQTLKDAPLELKIVGFVVVSLLIGGLFVGFFSVLFIRSDVLNTAITYSDNTVSIITEHINNILTEGKLNDIRAFTEKQKGVLEGIESIVVLNSKGQDVLRKESQEGDIIAVSKIKETKSRFIQKTKKEIFFYNPLINSARCMGCHKDGTEGSIIGAVKVSVSTRGAYERVIYRVKVVLIYLVLGTFLLSVLLWLTFRITIIGPIKVLENAARMLSHGDLSLRVPVRFKDEMGRLSISLTKAAANIGRIIQRAVAVSNAVENITAEVEKESKKVVEGSLIETEVISKTSQSIEELNTSIGEIAESVGGLIASAEQTAVSLNEMATATEQIAKNTIDLSMTIDSTSTSIDEMSINIKEIANRAEELSQSIEETLSAIKEINSAIKEVETNTKESAKLSQKVTSDATTIGMVAIEKTAEGMERIKTTVQKTAMSIEKLSKRSEEIGKILNVIDEITDQTTLLALNAAILAAQAGEHGKGFSVVADEIKDLAERTSFSTQEISSLIQSVQSEIKEAVTSMEEGLKTVDEGSILTREAKESFKNIIESSRQSNEMVSSIECAAFEQTKSVGFVTDTMVKIENMSTQIATATAQQSKEISLISSAAEKIREVTKQVKNATIEQSKGERELYRAAENVSTLLQEISNAINKQKSNTNNIFISMERIMTLPEENRNRAFSMNKNLRNLLKGAGILITKLNRFKVATEDETNILNMGVIPLDAPAEMDRRFTPLVEYLTRKLNKLVELRLAVDFTGTIKDIGERVTDICFMTPSTYIEAKERYGVEVLVKALRDGKPYHHTVIIAKENGRINKIEDIKGASFAFGDSHSTSSHLIPRAMLLEAGIDLKDLSFYNYLGHHEDVAMAVINGEFDAGGVMEATALKFKDKGLKFLKYSFEIPEFNITVNKDIPEKEKLRIKQALLKLDNRNPQDTAILKSIDPKYTGFVEATYEDYIEIRGLMQKFGLL